MKPRVRVLSEHRIDTERLLLLPPAKRDAGRVARMIGVWDVARWLVRVPFPYRVEHAEAWVERSSVERAAGTGWAFLISDRETDSLLGCIDLSLEGGVATGALGYWLGLDHWRCGYATEAVRAVIELGFSMIGLRLITASALIDNQRSRHVLEKAGLTRLERRIEDSVDHGPVETDFFVLDRKTWLARKDALA